MNRSALRLVQRRNYLRQRVFLNYAGEIDMKNKISIYDFISTVLDVIELELLSSLVYEKMSCGLGIGDACVTDTYNGPGFSDIKQVARQVYE